MGQVRHGSATTTRAARTAIQRSQVEGPSAIGSRAGLRVRATDPGTGDQHQDVGEVGQAGDGRGFEDWPDGTTVHRARCWAAPNFACRARGTVSKPTNKPRSSAAMCVSKPIEADRGEDQSVDDRSGMSIRTPVNGIVQSVCIVLEFPISVGWLPPTRSSESSLGINRRWRPR